ncbi:hypothetical protein SCHPADRAFT_896094 [Schizopora paradoxa]|uniref:Uncharacterized protein n=1 Tax=Schizopora paradoxa TaxID=27342 RepID=A0A0H2RLC5_9AGAM|nr:hypothetical protein SCHPADRAFT_896094 [Schizopora paradoxa]
MDTRNTVTRTLVIQNLTVVVNCEKGFGSKPMKLVLNVSDDPEGAQLTAQGIVPLVSNDPKSVSSRVSITNKKIRILKRLVSTIEEELEEADEDQAPSERRYRLCFIDEMKELMAAINPYKDAGSPNQVLELDVARVAPGQVIEGALMLPNVPKGPLSRQWVVIGSESREEETGQQPSTATGSRKRKASNQDVANDDDHPQAGPSTAQEVGEERQCRWAHKDLLGWVIKEDAELIQAGRELGKTLAGFSSINGTAFTLEPLNLHIPTFTMSNTNSSEFHMNNLTIVVTCDTELQARPLFMGLSQKLVINVTNPVVENAIISRPITSLPASNHADVSAVAVNALAAIAPPTPSPTNVSAVAANALTAIAPPTPRPTQTEGSPVMTVSSVTESYTSPQSNSITAEGRMEPSPAATVSSVTESYTSSQPELKDSTPRVDALVETPRVDDVRVNTQDYERVLSAIKRDPEGCREILELNISPIRFPSSYRTPPPGAVSDETTIPDSLQSARTWMLNLRSPGAERTANASSTRRARPPNHAVDLFDQRAPSSSKRRRVDPDESPTKRLGSHRLDRIVPNPTSHNASSTTLARPTNAEAHRTLRYVSLEPVPLLSGGEVRPEWLAEAEEINRKGRAAFEVKLKKPYLN